VILRKLAKTIKYYTNMTIHGLEKSAFSVLNILILNM
jgi:hypothetical protein